MRRCCWIRPCFFIPKAGLRYAVSQERISEVFGYKWVRTLQYSSSYDSQR